MSIAENVKEIREKIARAAIESGRKPEDITLVAATKMNDADRVKEAVFAGIDVAGENRVQELLEKYEQGAYDGVPLHFIGTLQTNKVKYLIGKVAMIQSVGSIKCLAEISRLAKKHDLVQDVLIEVNIGGEESKSGIPAEELSAFLDQAAKMENIHVRGLMTIPPILGKCEENSRFFYKMHELFVDMSAKKYDNINMDFLSMGMSDDYEDAIRCGANIVRVGTGIFGARHYQ